MYAALVCDAEPFAGNTADFAVSSVHKCVETECNVDDDTFLLVKLKAHLHLVEVNYERN
jgi:hypothetical protein